MTQLVADKRLEHEDAYRQKLAELCGLAKISTNGTLEERAAAAVAAMRQGAQTIFQDAILDPP